MVAAVLGYRLILTMPESMSIERARELIAENKNNQMPMQFENMSNVEIHRQTTAQEIAKKNLLIIVR